MTREEAKKIFSDLLLFGKAPCKKEELEDLCKVVLTALEQEPTTKNDKVDCEHTDCNNCVNHKYCDYESTTKNDLEVDCISRAEAIRVASGYCHPSNVAKELAKLPSVTPQEPKTGHWKPYLKEGLRYQCSACDSRFDTPWEYCPHCGAKMAETEADNGDD